MEDSIKMESDLDTKWIKSESDMEKLDCGLDIKIEIDVDVGNNNLPGIKQEDDQMRVSSDFLAELSVPKIPLCKGQSSKQIHSTYLEESDTQARIGSGSKKVPFFYENRESPAFPPVYVDTEEQVKAVAAFAAEKEVNFNIRSQKRKGESTQIPQYTTEAAIAISILEESILKHITSCFTVKGMRVFKAGAKKINYPKRSTIIKINQEKKPSVNETINNRGTNATAEYASKDEVKVESGFGASPFKTKVGLMKTLKLSKELSEMLDIAPDKALTKLQIKKCLSAYIKKHNLQDPDNTLWFKPDKRMEPIFGKEKMRCSEMINFLKGHV